MPNHIQNKLQIIGTSNQVKEVLNFISSKDEEGKPVQIDFNKIKPMPEGMEVSPHSGVEMWAKICTGQIDFSSLFKPLGDSISNLLQNRNYGTLADKLSATTAMEHLTGKRKGTVKDFSDEDFEIFITCLKNYRNHGFISWYEWSIKNWGTKWNAYGQNDERNKNDTIYFETAWSSPIKLIQELSVKFPEVTIQLDYADEDSGSNTGKITFNNGDAIEVNQPENGSKEGYEIYFELHPDSVSNYKLVGDRYEYIED